jgi:hypothetical protein
MEFVPDKGELLGFLKDARLSLSRHLIVTPDTERMKLEVQCKKCDYFTEVNPDQTSKKNWFCRNCGGNIVYDIQG